MTENLKKNSSKQSEESSKTDKDKRSQTLEVLTLQDNTGDIPFNGIKIPKKRKFAAKDILRIHSQLISTFIKGTLDSSEAKTLSYLCTNYLAALSQVELETRLAELEERVSDEKL